MQLFKIILTTLLLGSVYGNAQTFKPLKEKEGSSLPSLKKAKLTDVHLASLVKYFDIKYYHSSNKSYYGGFSFDMKAWKTLSKKEKREIQRQRPLRKGVLFAVKPLMLDGGPMLIANIHYIDNSSNVYTFSSRKKLLLFLGTIDTPTELAILFLSKEGRVRYKKVGFFYIIRTDYVYTENDGTDNCYQDIEHIVMDKKGKIISNKTTTKTHAAKKYEMLRKKFMPMN